MAAFVQKKAEDLRDSKGENSTSQEIPVRNLGKTNLMKPATKRFI
jgi:hypothetical protein